MPNGGSDCCGTCWFNSRNRGKAGYPDESVENEASHCQIRGNVAIEAPFWTYCANHPRRRPDRDPIPIGPITRAGDSSPDDPDLNPLELGYRREVWIRSPDTEEIRQHLLELLGRLCSQVSGEDAEYPLGWSLGEVVIMQLGEFREQRAERQLQWLIENSPEWGDYARAVLAHIKGTDR